VTDLDSLARAATQELLERTAPDLPGRYVELKRIRARRTTAKVVAVAVAVAVAAGGWRLGSGPDRVDPAPLPGKVLNGTLVAATFDGKSAMTWVTVSGKPLAFHPTDIANFASVRFTKDGTSVVYPDTGGQVVMVDVTNGSRHVLGDCLGEACESSLSPDGQVLAFGGANGVRLRHVDSESVELLDAEGVGVTSSPSWSPDGSQLAFIARDGVYVMASDGSDLRLVHPSTDPAENVTSVSWSPDGSRLAFFDTKTLHNPNYDEDKFTAMTIRPDGTGLVALHGAGHCFCAGLTPPYLTWSPDGDLVAVATTKGSGPWGVYVVHPDGSGWERVASGSFGHLAWQPLID
jgi:WD40 repeat protein